MKKARRQRKAEQKRIVQNIGRLHAVKCEWCNLKMACSCYFDQCRDKRKEPHPLVMCPRCQVTEFLNLVFGGKSRKTRSI
jgi:hypothetical protein